jgi:arsenite-transporting ATPase
MAWRSALGSCGGCRGLGLKVLGAGCSKCRSTIGIIERTAHEAGIEVEIVKVENPDEIRPRRACHAGRHHRRPVVHSGGLPRMKEVQSWFKPATVGFVDHPTRHLFFTGKGGVGKTSLSTATALMLADAGKKVLLVSTDAASNLDEMLGVELRNTPVAVPGAPGLSVLNIDPTTPPSRTGSACWRRWGADATAEELSTVREQLSGACTTEIASFDEFSSLLADGPRLGPHRLRHGADRAHLALAQPAQGLDRVPAGQ